ncbi:Mg2+-importing ATPase [Luteibacter jiangsuensis]|uniref:Magnesium-transporting ATPase, P-type 1 n=1 Tax=Luteibacter jiangsuensis TaxID=637577 RepID=A0ABT9SV28_9GAMM|nr:magnesium-translocating P-type ATPase [Luteibacter jiangsuensis]MDQ0008198.1 Mg2+-importing ATPase [Luteibacter jiangsuensis]
MRRIERYWAEHPADVLATMESGGDGLSSTAAAARLEECGSNTLAGRTGHPMLRLLLSRFTNPLVVILIVAAVISLLAREWADALIIMGIVLLTAVLSFVQEYRASIAIDALRRRVSITACVIRSGRRTVVPAESIVPGDIVELSAGALVPADCLLLTSRDCFVDQAALTGESLPVEKLPDLVAADSGLAERTNSVFMGTSVRSGWASAVVVNTGKSTVFGSIAGSLASRPPETEFERGLRRFGGFLIRMMFTVVIIVLGANILLHRPTIDTLLFAAAIAVGLSPELLPAILAITLSHGARAMAREGVIVKRLDAIENLGCMDVLCTDKTGTLTRGVIGLDGAVDPRGQPSDDVLRLATLNAQLQSGIHNPLDEAIVSRGTQLETPGEVPAKIDEIPYDFQRRRVSIVITEPTGPEVRMVTKGAVANVLETCASLRVDQQDVALDATIGAELTQRFVDWSKQGFRVLAIAAKRLQRKDRYDATDEVAMTLVGFLLFLDPPEIQAASALKALGALGVSVKVITGDNRFVATHVAEAIGMPVDGMLTGSDLRQLTDEALWQRAPATNVFSGIEPNQKERIITALRKSGHVVGYLGDGINDTPALHAADVGISVDTAVDVAKEAADFVLLEHDLDVICRGINEGRHAFANTIKYIFIATSSNFGNTIGMALASIYLPFLPLLAKQILLNNFLGDVPSMGIAGDHVDREWAHAPHRWDIRLIRRSMFTFGLSSTAFDLLTFAVLLAVSGGNHEIFRTGWFVESLLTELWVLLVIRTPRPFYRSRPGRFLAWGVSTMTVVAVSLPYLPGVRVLGFVPLSLPLLATILLISLLYVACAEVIKRPVYRRLSGTPSRTGGIYVSRRRPLG